MIKIPWGSDMLAPSIMACAREWSPVSRAYAAAFSASQISFLPSKAGAVSQNSSRLDRSCPSVSGTSLFHFGFSGFKGWFRPIETKWTYTRIICCVHSVPLLTFSLWLFHIKLYQKCTKPPPKNMLIKLSDANLRNNACWSLINQYITI